MKKITISTLIILLFALANAQGIEFFHGSFDEAKTAAKEQGKLIFMDAYAVWCGPCKMMSNNVFPQQVVGDFFNENFINLKVDMEKGEGVTLRRTYGVSAYPTLLIIDETGKVVAEVKGARNAESLIDWAKKATLPSQASFDKLQAKYEAGDKSTALLKSLIKMNHAYKKDYNSLMQEYLNGLSDEEIINKENADFIFEYSNTTHSPGLKVLQSYESYFRDIKGNEKYNEKLNNIAIQTVFNAIPEQDEKAKDEALNFLKTYKPTNYSKLSDDLNLSYYEKTKNWEKYDAIAKKYIKSYAKNDNAVYNTVAWTYYMNIDDASKLKTAEKWMQKAIKEDDNYQNNITQAYLLYKLEDYSAAQDAVVYALTLAKEGKEKQNAEIIKKKIEEKLGK
ncbi:MAG: thioredoxin family protein [Chitinophagales bacterium]|nr:thioredoxin family protein [Chitinophagales bacterium]